MKKKQNVEICKLTDEKHLNLFKFHYKELGVNWIVASRRDEKHLEVVSASKQADAVSILPFSRKKNGEIEIHLIKEFRYALGKFLYSFPAGIVENGKDETETVKAEIFEELGGNVLTCACVDKSLFTTAGLTDESISFYEAEVELTGKQHLEKSENISILTVSFKKACSMLEDKKFEFDVKGKLALRLFLQKEKNKMLLDENEKLKDKLKNLKK